MKFPALAKPFGAAVKPVELEIWARSDAQYDTQSGTRASVGP
jgi:hypothetical protein